MPRHQKIYRCQVRCLCGDSIVMMSDDPLRLHNLNLICGGCGLFLGTVISRRFPEGYFVRLDPHEDLTSALGIPEPTWVN